MVNRGTCDNFQQLYNGGFCDKSDYRRQLKKKCVAAAEEQQAKNLAECVFKYADDFSGQSECSSVITKQYNEQIKSCN